MTMTIRTSTLVNAFGADCTAAGLAPYPAVAISSGVDPSVRFVGSSISVLKPLLLKGDIPSPGVFIAQPALRTHCLKSLTDPTSQYHWASYFVQIGALVRPPFFSLLARIALDFLRQAALLPDERVIIRASSRDPDLLEAVTSSVEVGLEIDGYGQSMYRHRFGLEGWAGRNVNFAIRCGEVLYDIGNLILIENGGTPVAAEVAIGVSVLICRTDSLQHPIMASPIADHLPINTWDQIKCGNALEASIALAREGLRPIARGRGRCFREYLEALSELHKRAGVTLEDVYQAAEQCELGLAVENVPRERAAHAIIAHLLAQESSPETLVSSSQLHEKSLAVFDNALMPANF